MVCYYVGYVIVWVCIVGYSLVVVVLAIYISGFYPPCDRIYFYCCLIFDFWANIFIICFPYANVLFLVSNFGGWTYFSATCLYNISSADSKKSSASSVRSCGPNVCGGLQGSLPFLVAGDFVATEMGYVTIWLDDGFYLGMILAGSDC